VIQSNEIIMAFTAPYNHTLTLEGSNPPHPGYSVPEAQNFIIKHGLAVRALGITVVDAADAYEKSVANGAIGVFPPQVLVDQATGKSMTLSEIQHAGDVVLRFMSGDFDGVFLPNYVPVQSPPITYGLTRVDHCVTNVPVLFDTVDYLQKALGFHEFSEFTAADVGTVDSGLNSMVLASNNEYVLLPINEPTFGTKRKSQIQMYLEHNMGPGVQHVAIKTDNIFETMRELLKRKHLGGFEFMPAPDHSYYERVPQRIGQDVLNSVELKDLEELGLLADKDDQGVLLQVFTKPIGDRPTIFFEIIQRIGCDRDEGGHVKEQMAGCGGFGKGNFSELFRSIEEFEKTINGV
jgi:4-hydroxyphenylpyruvate dioxygenase